MNIEDCPLNLDATLCCGQVFRWKKQGDWWCGAVGDRFPKVRQVGKILEFQNVDEAFVKHYFSLDHDLYRIRKELSKDAYVCEALREFWGLRLVRQDPWECLISFVCATYKSVAAIQQMLFKLSKKFGEKASFENCDFYSFPTPEKLAKADLNELESCGLGYRSKYVYETSRRIQADKYDLEALKKMSYEEAQKELYQFPGVGPKVADCVLLFSLDKLVAFPVDVWVKRIILRHYSGHFSQTLIRKLADQKSFSDSDYEKLSKFGRNYFGEYAGYAQEYLYHFERLRR